MTTTSTTTTSTDKNSLAYRPEFVEGDLKANEESLTAFGNQVSAQIDAMQAQRESWRNQLRDLYEADTKQDDYHRELKRQVLIGEAEALSNPTFHRWMRSREQHGVGREKVDSWYVIDELLVRTPYLSVVPFPRNLTDAGWEAVNQQIEQLVVSMNFTIEWWPLLQHEGDGARRRSPGQTAFECHSVNDVRRLVQSSPELQAALVETPCLLLGDGLSTRRLAAESGSSPVVAYVVRGTVIAVEPYYTGDNVPPVLFPKKIAPTVSNQSQPITSANCRALVELRDWLEALVADALPERSLAVCVMMHCLSPKTIGMSILNVAPLDAVDCQYFAWSDLVGLTVQTQSRREQMMMAAERVAASETAAAEGAAASNSESGEEEKPDGEASNAADAQASLEQDRASAIAAAQAMAPPKVDLVFRGPWATCDRVEADSDVVAHQVTVNSVPTTPAVVPPPPSADQEGADSSSKKQQHQDPEAKLAPSSSSDATSSGSNNNIVLGAAAVACLASAALGLTLGMKMNHKN